MPSLSQLGHYYAQLQATPVTLCLSRQRSLERCCVQLAQLSMEALRSALSQLLRQTLVEEPLARHRSHSSHQLLQAPSPTPRHDPATGKQTNTQKHSLSTPVVFRKVKTRNSLTFGHGITCVRRVRYGTDLQQILTTPLKKRMSDLDTWTGTGAPTAGGKDRPWNRVWPISCENTH